MSDVSVKAYEFPVLSLNKVVKDTDASDYDENFAAIKEAIDFGEVRSPERIARILGGIYVEASLSPTTDTTIRHATGRRPSQVIIYVDLDGLGGVVYGNPLGDPNATGILNVKPWTENLLFLRSSRSGRFAVVVT